MLLMLLRSAGPEPDLHSALARQLQSSWHKPLDQHWGSQM